MTPVRGQRSNGGSETYGIRSDYVSRTEPSYFNDPPPKRTGRRTYQADVYAEAGRIARRLSASRIIDLGAGTGDKLRALSAANECIALDYGANLAVGRDLLPALDWRHYDAELDTALPVAPTELTNALIVCADVLEHLIDPSRLLSHVATALDGGALVAVLSTPDRQRSRDRSHLGPPPNPHHVREWTKSELVCFLRSQGFTAGAVGWTRSHDQTMKKESILVVLSRDARTLAHAGVIGQGGDNSADFYPLVGAGKPHERLVRFVREAGSAALSTGVGRRSYRRIRKRIYRRSRNRPG